MSPAKLLPFVFRRTRKPPSVTKPTSWLDLASGLRLDVTVTAPGAPAPEPSPPEPSKGSNGAS